MKVSMVIMVLGIITATATAVYAPEIRIVDDPGSLHVLTYRVEDDGRIVDRDGKQKGWMIGKDVYDNGWHLKCRTGAKGKCTQPET